MLVRAWNNWNSLTPLVENSLKELNRHLPYAPAIPVLGIYPKEMKAYVYTKTKIINVHIGFTCSGAKLETTQESTNR